MTNLGYPILWDPKLGNMCLFIDLQIPRVPLWKDLDPVDNIVSAEDIGNIWNAAFALSKWPHALSADLVCRVLLSTVHQEKSLQKVIGFVLTLLCPTFLGDFHYVLKLILNSSDTTPKCTKNMAKLKIWMLLVYWFFLS